MKENKNITLCFYGDSITAGCDSSKRMNVAPFMESWPQLVTAEIKLLQEEYAGDAPLTVLLSQMSDKHGLSEDKTEQIVRNLVQKGVIYEPTTGYFRLVA